MLLPELLQAAAAVDVWNAIVQSFREALDGFIAIIIFALIATLGFISVGLLASARQARRRLQDAERKIAELRESASGGPREAGLGAIEEVIHEDRYLRNLSDNWRELRRSLLPDPFDQSYKRIQSAETFFNDEDSLQAISFGWFRFTFLEPTPSLMTGLGILGTFLGIAVGLGQLAELSTATDMMTQIEGVIIGLASAFWTSIVGLLSALAATVLHSIQEHSVLGALHRFRGRLDVVIPRATAEELLLEQTAKLEGIRRESEEARSYLATVANDLADELGNRFNESLGQHLAPQLEELLKLYRQQVDTTTQASLEGVERLTNAAVGSISAALEESFGNMVGAVDRFGDRFDGMLQSLDGAISSVHGTVEQQQQVLEATRQATEAARAQAEAATNELHSTHQAANAVGELAVRLSKLQHGAVQLLKSQAELDQTARERVSEVGTELGRTTAAFNEAAAALGRLLPVFSEQAGNMTAAVRSLVTSSLNAARSLEESVGRLNERLGSEGQLLDGYKGATSAFVEAFGQSERTFGTFGRAVEGLEQLRERFGQLATQLHNINVRSGELANRLNQGIENTRGSLETASQSLSKVAGETDVWAGKAVQAIERFSELMTSAVESSLGQYDQSLSQAVQGLRSALGNLEDLAEELAQHASKMRSAR